MTVDLPEDLERAIRDLVDGGRFASPDAVVAEAVRLFVRRHRPPKAPKDGESAYDAFMRAGVIGMLDSPPGSPTDLSTNPIHMQGFGQHDRE